MFLFDLGEAITIGIGIINVTDPITIDVRNRCAERGIATATMLLEATVVSIAISIVIVNIADTILIEVRDGTVEFIIDATAMLLEVLAVAITVSI